MSVCQYLSCNFYSTKVYQFKNLAEMTVAHVDIMIQLLCHIIKRNQYKTWQKTSQGPSHGDLHRRGDHLTRTTGICPHQPHWAVLCMSTYQLTTKDVIKSIYRTTPSGPILAFKVVDIIPQRLLSAIPRTLYWATDKGGLLWTGRDFPSFLYICLMLLAAPESISNSQQTTHTEICEIRARFI